VEVVSEQSQRKALYQKIMPLFPDGWMNTGYISREGMYTHPNRSPAAGAANADTSISDSIDHEEEIRVAA
jgi:hypothetical protein